jgi:6-pyruvoyl-tetrahydropterin synthase
MHPPNSHSARQRRSKQSIHSHACRYRIRIRIAMSHENKGMLSPVEELFEENQLIKEMGVRITSER